MQKTVITSMGRYGFDLYGRNFLETFGRYWPKDIAMVAFMEPDMPPTGGLVGAGRTYLAEPIDNVPGIADFIKAVEHFPVMCGETPKGHHIFNDARSGRATFMHAYAVKRFGGKIFWLDSDIVTHAEVTHEFLDSLLPDDKFCAYLGRREVFSENGFIGFNAEHPLARKFMDSYLGLYTSGAVFLEPGWNDCCVFDRIREVVQRGFPEAFVNIGKDVPYNPDSQHVFINSVLGSVMDHLKGGRKALGRSPLMDLAKPRLEPYWQPEAMSAGVATR
jgi:hypothetical protein